MCDIKAGFSSPHCSSCWNVVLLWGIKKHKWDPRWWLGHEDSVFLMVEPLIISGWMGCLETKSVIEFGVVCLLHAVPPACVNVYCLGHLCSLCHQRTCAYVGHRLWKLGVGTTIIILIRRHHVKLTFKDLLFRPQNSALLSLRRPSFF